MQTLIGLAFTRTRTVLIGLAIILVAGTLSYGDIPKEAEPDIAVPFVYVSMTHDGISPRDAERLLVRPMEKELQSIDGVKTMRSTAGEGHASVQLEFNAGFDAEQALDDVRKQVDLARPKLPSATDEPEVVELNVALFPVLTVSLSGPIPERGLVGMARDLKDRIEALPGVLEADIGGDREAVLEIIVDPVVMETYGVDYGELFTLVSNNNLLVAAGALDTGSGRLSLKVPGVIEDAEAVLNMPVKVDGDRVVTFGEVASIRRGFKDPQGFARVGGQPAVTLEVKKRVGANIIDTIAQVREVVESARRGWPVGVEVAFMQDKSEQIREMLTDLQNNVLSAVLLVMVVIIAALGPRSALLVGLAIPGAFLATIAVLELAGHTLNIVVLFSLILVVGMLVDGAIVVTELADRRLARGRSPGDAFGGAAARMAWPVIASTVTTIAVFTPLLFWPGLVGEFMSYLPVTVIIALLASLAMALVFIPVLGAAITPQRAAAGATGDAPATDGAYARLLATLLRRPGTTLAVALLAMASAYVGYGALGKGVEFFPDVEPEFALIHVHARGDLSVVEKDDIVRRVEQRVLGMDEVRSVYARSFNTGGNATAEDVIGTIQLEFIDWQLRRPAAAILADMRERTAALAGIRLEFRKAESGPSGGKPIQIELLADDYARTVPAADVIRDLMARQGNFVDVEDDRPLPGIEWRLEVDRELAARYGADVQTLGNAVRLLTGGIKLTDYRPDDATDEVDIRVRFPFSARNLGQLDQLRVATPRGMVPIANFVTLRPAAKSGIIKRVDGQRVLTLQAGVRDGALPDAEVAVLRQAIAAAGLEPAVTVRFKGEDADQREAMAFLTGAFVTAVLAMALILVTMFNSIYQALLVLSAIVFSTAGVLLGLLVTAQPFGIVMVGLGIIALAGIVVNNNIVLIDTYNRLRATGMAPPQAALQTGVRRVRPVFLTAFTTVLGLLPMVLAMNVDLIDRSISFGAPSTQWWTQLASAIAGGLAFATVLTLLLTPCLLLLGERLGSAWPRRSAAARDAGGVAVARAPAHAGP